MNRWTATLLSLVTCLVVMFSGTAQAQEEPKRDQLAVLNLRATTDGFSIQFLTALTDRVRVVAVKDLGDKFNYMSRERILEIESGWACDAEDTENCNLTVGQQLQADYIVTGEVSREGRTHRFTLRLQHVWTKKTLNMETGVVYSMKALEGAVEKAARSLVRFLLVGTLDLASIPKNAEVFIDRSSTADCRTPCEFSVKPGKHVLQLTHDGYPLQEREIEVQAGQRLAFNIEFPLPETTLTVTATSKKGESLSGQVSIKGGSVDRNLNLPVEIRLPVGSYSVTVITDAGEFHDTVRLEPGQPKRVDAVLNPPDVPVVVRCKKRYTSAQLERIRQGGTCTELQEVVDESGECRRQLKRQWKSAQNACASGSTSMCQRQQVAEREYEAERALYRSLVMRMRQRRCPNSPR